MRRRKSSGGVTVQAIAGTRAVYFGFDLTEEARAGCLGFAVHRRDHAAGEGSWLPAFKTFRSVVPVPGSDAIYLTVDHPIQSWPTAPVSATRRRSTRPGSTVPSCASGPTPRSPTTSSWSCAPPTAPAGSRRCRCGPAPPTSAREASSGI